MNTGQLFEITMRVISKYPRVARYLDGAKSIEFFRRTLVRLVRSVFDGNLGGDFVEIMTNLIRGQIIDAHVQAWKDEGGDGDPPQFLRSKAESMVLDQSAYVPGYFRDIVTARVNETSIEPLIVRADIWANRYNEAYNGAVAAITEENGGKLMWVMSEPKEHCETCSALNGKIAFATEWTISGFKPQHAPNPMLDCGGWQCGCSLVPTKKRRTPNALTQLLDIAVGGAV